MNHMETSRWLDEAKRRMQDQGEPPTDEELAKCAVHWMGLIAFDNAAYTHACEEHIKKLEERIEYLEQKQKPPEER